MSELQDRIHGLPKWAQEHIKRLEVRSGPAIEAAARARRDLEKAEERAKRLGDSNEALLEILRRAGEGGSDWAAKVVSVLEGYEIFRPEPPNAERE